MDYFSPIWCKTPVRQQMNLIDLSIIGIIVEITFFSKPRIIGMKNS